MVFLGSGGPTASPTTATAALPHLEALNGAAILDEGDLKEHIRILEEAFLQRHDEELACLEVFPDHQADVLCMRKVQCRVDLIQNVHWGRVILEQCKDETESQKRSLPAGQFRQ